MPTTYEIRVKEPLDAYWQEWFDGVQLSTTHDGATLLTCMHFDQVALHGVLTKIYNLRLTLLSVNSVEHTPNKDAAGVL